MTRTCTHQKRNEYCIGSHILNIIKQNEMKSCRLWLLLLFWINRISFFRNNVVSIYQRFVRTLDEWDNMIWKIIRKPLSAPRHVVFHYSDTCSHVDDSFSIVVVRVWCERDQLIDELFINVRNYCRHIWTPYESNLLHNIMNIRYWYDSQFIIIIKRFESSTKCPTTRPR